MYEGLDDVYERKDNLYEIPAWYWESQLHSVLTTPTAVIWVIGSPWFGRTEQSPIESGRIGK
jgi:hypothetical protein